MYSSTHNEAPCIQNLQGFRFSQELEWNTHIQFIVNDTEKMADSFSSLQEVCYVLSNKTKKCSLLELIKLHFMALLENQNRLRGPVSDYYFSIL